MIVGEILSNARLQLDDTVEPYRWSDDELARYLDNAVNDLCKCKVIKDSNTPEICTINVVANVQTYQLDNRIISIERAKLSKATIPLNRITIDIADSYYSDWETTAETPSAFIHEGNKIILIWKPDSDDILNLTVYRLPLQPITMASVGDEPEIPLEYHGQLCKGIYMQAYDKHDSDTYDPTMRDRYAGEWNIFKDRVKRDWIKKYEVKRRNVPHRGAI